MQDVYKLDYTQAKPNRFADKFDNDAVVVVLDPDVAVIFRHGSFF